MTILNKRIWWSWWQCRQILLPTLFVVFCQQTK